MVVISFVGGLFWSFSGGSKEQVPSEYTTSHETLRNWAEELYEEVRYNFSSHLLPEKDPFRTTEVAKPSKVFIAPKEILFAPPNTMRVMNAKKLTKSPLESEIRNCPWCHKDFEPKDSRQKFCSRSCGSLSHSKRKAPILTCSYCSSSFERRSYKSRRHFCQRECKKRYDKENPTIFQSDKGRATG